MIENVWHDIEEQINILYWVANRSEYPQDWNTEIFDLLALIEND